MRFADLSPEDQALLNTDFGEFDKIAEEKVAIANEMYLHGFNDLASSTADEFDKLAAMAGSYKDEEEEKDAASDEAASELGALIERGFFDGLKKLGSERHGDTMHYIYPFIEEKVAALGAAAASQKFFKKAAAASAAGGMFSKGVKAVKSWGKSLEKNISKGTAAQTGKSKMKHYGAAAKQVAKPAAYAAGGALAAKGGYDVMTGK